MELEAVKKTLQDKQLEAKQITSEILHAKESIERKDEELYGFKRDLETVKG